MLHELEKEFGIVVSRVQKIFAQAGHKVLLGYFKRPGWQSELPFYLFNCSEHGLVYDYPHG